MIPISELDLIKIGEIIKAHGYKGELVIKLKVDFNRLKKTELLFFEIKGNMVPFFYETTPKPYKKSGLLVKFENMNSDTDVDKILHASVFTTFDKLEEEETVLTNDIEDYKVFDSGNYIGKVAEYLNIPSNPVLLVTSEDNNEILIPINEEFLISIDEENKKIMFKLPDGLIEINK